MEEIQGDLYDFPQYYDLVFGSDWTAELQFLKDCFERFAQVEVQHVFEPACGTGRLLYRLARAEFDVSGLDLNKRAVEYCNQRLSRHGFPESAFVGDMTDFRLKRKVEAAFNMINSFRHLQTEKGARAHLQCVAAALKRGGIYVLGLHLTPTDAEPTEEESWSARRGNLCVNTRLWTTHRDLKNREEQFEMRYDIYTPTRSRRISDTIIFRTYTVRQLKQLLKGVSDLELVAAYDFAYDLARPLELNSEAEDTVLVLRKT
jgi:SAM-dependent methyltransferase